MTCGASIGVVTGAGRLAVGVRLAVAGLGVATGLLTVGVARRADGASFVGRSTVADAVLLLAGWSVMAAGLWLVFRPGGRVSGALLTAGGFAWFVGEWNTQLAGSALVFTTGLVWSTVAPVVIAHGLLRYRGRRLDRFDRAGLALGYVSAVVVGGVLPALLFDPGRQDCMACPGNLLALQSVPGWPERLVRCAWLIGPVWSGLLAIGVGRTLLGAPPGAGRLAAPVLLPGVGFLLAVCALYVDSLGLPYAPVTTSTRLLWAVEAGMLVLLAAGTAWPAVHRGQVRNRVAQLVIDVAAAAPGGGLRESLSQSLRDPDLQVLYRLDDESLVDAAGVPAQPSAGRATTRLVRGDTVAVVVHRPALLGDPELISEITRTARLMLDNESLQAQSRAQLAELEASRARIVESADAERRRLERDLHDGAQQKLVAFSLALQLAALRRSGDPPEVARLSRARAEMGGVLAELRVLARGIYPRELADEGLASAIGSLREASDVPIQIGPLPAGRYPHAVEATAFQLVAQVAKGADADGVRVWGADSAGQLIIEVAGQLRVDLAVLQDRLRRWAATFPSARMRRGPRRCGRCCRAGGDSRR